MILHFSGDALFCSDMKVIATQVMASIASATNTMNSAFLL